MFRLGTLLLQRGFSITIIHTLYNAPDPSHYPNFRFAPLLMNASGRRSSAPKIPSPRSALFHKPAGLLGRLLEEATQEGEDPVACLLADFVLYQIMDAAGDLGVRWVVVQTSSAAYLKMLSDFDVSSEGGDDPIQENWLEEGITEAPTDRVKDLMRLTGIDDEIMYQIFMDAMDWIRTSAALVTNTFEDLEAAALTVIRRRFPCPVFAVGPLNKFSQNAFISLLEQDRGCITWLDRHPAGSVIYVSFGSLACVEKEELAEVAWGLAGSGQPFLWVVREGSVRGEAAAAELPAGFVEETRGRGMVMAWVPQQEVLAHPAVGAFWTHCGWNSVMESLCEGVPMLCRPAFGDQMVNARYVSHVWKVGLTLEGALQREQVERAVRALLVEDEGRELRERARRMKEKAGCCIKEGGSSYRSLDDLIDLILS